jgi:hypothetical protein
MTMIYPTRLRIQRTVQPRQRLPFNEWAKALRVSTRVPMQRHYPRK